MSIGEFKIIFRFLATAAVFLAVFLGNLLFSKNGFPDQDSTFPEKNNIQISVNSRSPWTDSGVDVLEGQSLFFQASGGISLQKGNPMASCGPDGYNLKTVQQPLKDRNIGALVGKVVQVISVEIDKETEKETRNELVEEFFIGSEREVIMPINGRLFLGINENVTGDNEGVFQVKIIFEHL